MTAAEQAGWTVLTVLVTIPALVAACYYALAVLKDVLKRMAGS